MEVIQLYLALNCLSFLIPSITGAGKAAIIIYVSLTKETISLPPRTFFLSEVSTTSSAAARLASDPPEEEAGVVSFKVLALAAFVFTE